MDRRDRIEVAAALFGGLVLTIIYLAILFLFPLPVHKPNKETKCCSSAICAAEHHHEKRAVYTDAYLQAWYANFNELYFFDQLPKVVEVSWGDLTAQGDMGLTQRRSDGSFLITIDRKTNSTESTAKMTLAHETCHVAVPTGTELDDHGPRFQKCMVNLATHGAFADIW